MRQPFVIFVAALLVLAACAPQQQPREKVKPALNYARKVGGGNVPGFDPPRVQQGAFASGRRRAVVQGQTAVPGGYGNVAEAQYANHYQQARHPADARAQYRMVKDLPPEVSYPLQRAPSSAAPLPQANMMDGVEVYRSQRPNALDYNGPLSLGDPGVSSSLWRASKRGNHLFQDDRAWQPYDLVTIVISENAEGTQEADTEVKTSSEIITAINNFFGFEADLTESNSNIDLANLINATTDTDYSGEGDTTRKGTLEARISAMVVEVLPGGVLRIEGEKIISVNSEEEVMVISGLVRPRDITSTNEVNSSKVAQLRVDFFGEGPVASAQGGGWLGNIVRRIWPF